MPPQTVIIITGPTASGKTELAIALAQHFKTSIISADSRQCFCQLNIGVAKPTPAQLRQVKHFFINSHSIDEQVNAAVFETLAMQWSHELFSASDTIIMSGGTGLYIKAFREGLDEIAAVKDGVRKNILALYQQQGLDWLKQSIRIADPLFYASGEMANPQRMIRALEVVQSTGRSILSFRNPQKKQRPFRIIEFAIRLQRKELYERIDARVDAMIHQGLLEEVKSLIPYQHLNALQTVGYTELFSYLNGQTGIEEAISRIKQNTRHYTKRQLTWLNKNENLVWLETDFLNKILEKVEGT